MSMSYSRCASVLVFIMGLASVQSSSSATLSIIPSAVPGQCGASDVNDSGDAVGGCVPANQQGSPIAWSWLQGAASASVLPSLVPGLACGASGVTNGDTFLGSCTDANGRTQGVTWRPGGAAAVALLPLSSLLGLGSHVQSVPVAYNQNADIAGMSVTTESALVRGGETAAVVWPHGSNSPERIFNGLLSGNDDCSVAGLSEVNNGSIAIPLNCPVIGGLVQPKVAVRSSAGIYTVTALPVDPAAQYCVIAAVNVSQQMVGVCSYASAPSKKMAYWSPNGTNVWALTVVGVSGPAGLMRNAGMDINASGHILMKYQRLQGTTGFAYYDPATNTAKYIQELSPNTGFGSAAIADNDRITVVGENAGGNAQSAIFDPTAAMSGGLSSPVPVPPVATGANSAVYVMSKSGTWGAGSAEDSSHTSDGVVTQLNP